MNDIKHFEIVNGFPTIWRIYEKIFEFEPNSTECQKCNEKLNPGCTYIPIEKDKYAKVNGYECDKCQCIYVKNSDEIIEILKDNPYSKRFTMNGINYSNYSILKKQKAKTEKKKKRKQKLEEKKIKEFHEYKQELSKVPSAVVMIAKTAKLRVSTRYLHKLICAQIEHPSPIQS